MKYYQFPSGKFYCQEHKATFKDTCPSCGNSQNTKSEVHEEFTNNSLTITHNSRRVYAKRVVRERFHSYRRKFEAEVQWDAIFEAETHMKNNVSFKRLDFPEAIVRVFRRSILVTLRSSQEIKGLPVKDAESRSRELVESIVARLPKSIKVKGSKLSSVHNAFVNHPTAQYPVHVKVNGQSRLITDNSHGAPEFEAVSTEFAVSDSQILEKFNEDLIVNNPEPLSVQQFKINHIVDVLDKYAVQMELHLEVERKTSVSLDKIAQYFDTHSRKVSHVDHFSSFPSCAEREGKVRATSLPSQSILARWF